MVYTPNFTAEGVEIYVDAIKQDVTVVKDSLSGGLLTSSPFNIGTSGNGIADEYQGKIDEVGIFRLILNQSQIQGIKDEIVEIGVIPEPPAPTPELDILKCPDTTTKALIFVLLSVMIGFFLILAIKTKVYFIGFFAAVMLLIMSLFFAPCMQLFAFILAIVGLVFLVWFCFLGLVQNPFTGKR